MFDDAGCSAHIQQPEQGWSIIKSSKRCAKDSYFVLQTAHAVISAAHSIKLPLEIAAWCCLKGPSAGYLVARVRHLCQRAIQHRRWHRLPLGLLRHLATPTACPFDYGDALSISEVAHGVVKRARRTPHLHADVHHVADAQGASIVRSVAVLLAPGAAQAYFLKVPLVRQAEARHSTPATATPFHGWAFTTHDIVSECQRTPEGAQQL